MVCTLLNKKQTTLHPNVPRLAKKTPNLFGRVRFLGGVPNNTNEREIMFDPFSVHAVCELDVREYSKILADAYKKEFGGNLNPKYTWPCDGLFRAAKQWAKDYPEILDEYIQKRKKTMT